MSFQQFLRDHQDAKAPRPTEGAHRARWDFVNAFKMDSQFPADTLDWRDLKYYLRNRGAPYKEIETCRLLWKKYHGV
jgi:hypothetical protein